MSGSSSYGNYRHHADLAHAFQILKGYGVPTTNIITMLYDDVAQDPENPFPGQLFNWPTDPGEAGFDVYKGLKKSYTGDSVTASNFMAVLTGNASAIIGGSGQVLQSGPEDKVFINFVNHGGSGLVAMPVGDYLYADQLNAALEQMNQTNMYSELVFYLEACESGSMFSDGLLSNNTRIYATTASNPQESSWGTYCPPGDVINGTDMGTCLGDLYSVNWMEDSDSSWHLQESLRKQFDLVQSLTNLSHPQVYGDRTFQTRPVFNFLTGWFSADNANNNNNNNLRHTTKHSSMSSKSKSKTQPAVHASSRMATILSLQHRANKGSVAAQAQLRVEILKLNRAEKAFMEFEDVTTASELNEIIESMPHPIITTWDCYRSAVKAFETNCGKFTDASLAYTKLLAQRCEVLGTKFTGAILEQQVQRQVEAACSTASNEF